jgi:hypothetical protein
LISVFAMLEMRVQLRDGRARRKRSVAAGVDRSVVDCDTAQHYIRRSIGARGACLLKLGYCSSAAEDKRVRL